MNAAHDVKKQAQHVAQDVRRQLAEGRAARVLSVLGLIPGLTTLRGIGSVLSKSGANVNGLTVRRDLTPDTV